jgi:hypothetical protein
MAGKMWRRLSAAAPPEEQNNAARGIRIAPSHPLIYSSIAAPYNAVKWISVQNRTLIEGTRSPPQLAQNSMKH